MEEARGKGAVMMIVMVPMGADIGGDGEDGDDDCDCSDSDDDCDCNEVMIMMIVIVAMVKMMMAMDGSGAIFVSFCVAVTNYLKISNLREEEYGRRMCFISWIKSFTQ